MINVELFVGSKKIPSVYGNFEITTTGVITANGVVVSLEEFNHKTNCEVNDVAVLTAIAYQRFNWPPVYWKHLIALRSIPDVSTPESVVLGIIEPVASLEYPGFYMIPYYSNYVISPDGLLLRRIGNREMMASRGPLGYYTYRMLGDDGVTQNELRHRILCYAFKPFPVNVEELDVNHKDGVPGNDWLDNLEWATRAGNMLHAYGLGLRSDNKPVAVRDSNTGNISIFPSCSSAGRLLGVSESTVSNRAKSLGLKSFNGLQFRFHPNYEPWPEIRETGGSYLVEFPDKTTKVCGCNEAARLAGLTRTSLLRALREGREYGTTNNRVTRLTKVPTIRNGG